MATVSGSIKRVILYGESFDVFADSEPMRKPTSEKEYKQTSGQTSVITMKKLQVIEGINLSISPIQHDALDERATNNESGQLSCVTADGSTYTTQGTITVGDFSLYNGSAEVSLIPDVEFTIAAGPTT